MRRVNQMQSKIENGKVTITLVPRINAANFEEIETEIDTICQGAPDCSVVLDASNLEYVSSAGLRALLKISKTQKDVSIVNVSRDVYDVFDMTGFTGAIPISRAMRHISVEGLHVVGRGGTATVYRLDDDKIIKVFRESMARDLIATERQTSQKLFLEGVPTAVPYDVVDCGEDGIGVVYEMLEAQSLLSILMSEPARAPELMRQAADLLKTISVVPADGLVRMTDLIRGSIDASLSAGIVTQEQHDTIVAFMGAIPDSDTFVHGDYHPGNIMVKDGEMMLIDLGAASRGNVLFDLAGMDTTMRTALELCPKTMAKASFQADREYMLECWKAFSDRFFEGTDEEQVRKMDLRIRAVSVIRMTSAALALPGFVEPDELENLKAFLDEHAEELRAPWDS